MAEKELEQYESFDVVNDLFLPIKEEEEKYASPILARFRENEVDPFEYLGEPKVEGVGPVRKVQDQEEQNKYSAAFLDFFKDLPEAAVTSTAESLANVGNNAVQLVGAGSNLLFRGTEKADEFSKATTSFAKLINKRTENFVKNIEQYRKDNDVNGVTDLMADIGIDIAAAVPINKMLKKTGLPSFIATPLSFGLAYGLTSGDDEAKANIIIDSQVINRTNELLNILEDTPESEVAELVATTFEGTAWASAGDRLIKVFKMIKQNIPAFINQQTVTTGAATAVVAGVADRASAGEKDFSPTETDNRRKAAEKLSKDKGIELGKALMITNNDRYNIETGEYTGSSKEIKELLKRPNLSPEAIKATNEAARISGEFLRSKGIETNYPDDYDLDPKG